MSDLESIAERFFNQDQYKLRHEEMEVKTVFGTVTAVIDWKEEKTAIHDEREQLLEFNEVIDSEEEIQAVMKIYKAAYNTGFNAGQHALKQKFQRLQQSINEVMEI